MRSEAGNYTCRIKPPNPDNSTNSSVTVIVQCKSQSCVTRPLLGFVGYMLYHLVRRRIHGKNTPSNDGLGVNAVSVLEISQQSYAMVTSRC